MLKWFGLLSVLSVLSVSSTAYDQSPFGINGLNMIHGRQSPNVFEDGRKTAKVMKDAGINWARLELWWGVLEPEKGKFDWTFSDKVAQLYRDEKMNGLVLLCYSSAWSGKPPADAEERALYANYVYQVVNRYKDTFHVWEIWNEPNIPTFWPEPNVGDYTLMLKEAYKAAKKADPNCVVLAASTSGPDLDFIKGMYQYGGWDSCDGISIHPYSMSGGPIVQRLDKILRMHQKWMASHATCRAVQINPHSVMHVISIKSLWITEMGWTTRSPQSEQDQAIYLTQSYVISLANGVEKLFWFCLNDWGEKWGIIKGTDPLDPKPSYKAYQRLTRALGSPGKAASFEGYLRMPLGVACYVFKKSENERILILWSERLTKTVSLKGNFHGEDIFGNPAEIKDDKITVGQSPILLIGPISPIGPIRREYNPYLEKKGQNLAINGSFDSLNDEGQADWWNAGRFEGSAKDGQFATVKGRGKAVSISQSGERAAYDEGPIPVDVGKKYRLTGWIKTENATGNNQIAFYWYGGNMWTYRGEVRTENMTGTHDWTKVSVTATVPEGTTFVRPNLVSENNSGVTYFDDVSLVEE